MSDDSLKQAMTVICMSLMTGFVIGGNTRVGWMMLLKRILNLLGQHGQNRFGPGYGQVAAMNHRFP